MKSAHAAALFLITVGLFILGSSQVYPLQLTTATLPQTLTVENKTWSIHRSTRVGYYYGTVDTYIVADVVPGEAGNGYSSLVRHGDELAALNIIYGLIGYTVPASMLVGLSPSFATVDVGAGGTLFHASVIGGVAPYTFHWYLNDTLQFYFTTSQTGADYIVAATNVGTVFLEVKCVDSTSVTVWSEAVLNVQNPSSPQTPQTPPQQNFSTLTIMATGQGTTDPAQGTYTSTYTQGQTLNVQATPATGWTYMKMQRNSEDWTTSNPGQFLNLAATETINVFFTQTPQNNDTLPNNNQTQNETANWLQERWTWLQQRGNMQLTSGTSLIMIGAIVAVAGSITKKKQE